jgi:putative oxidoreductase
MIAREIPTTAPASPARKLNVTLWVVQGLLAAFFLFAAAGPKLLGEATAVRTFDDIGVGQWFRYVVGVLELAGAIGLVIPRLARSAALGLAAVMLGAIITNLFVIDGGLLTLTPVILLALLGFVVWGRQSQTGG